MRITKDECFKIGSRDCRTTTFKDDQCTFRMIWEDMGVCRLERKITLRKWEECLSLNSKLSSDDALERCISVAEKFSMNYEIKCPFIPS